MEENYDIRNHIIKYFETYKRKRVLEISGISKEKLSLFLNKKIRISYDSFVLLIIAMDFKIIDNQGNVIIGNPGKTKEEIEDNTIKKQVLDDNSQE